MDAKVQPLRLLLALFLVLGCAPRVARADARGDARAAAKSHFERGSVLFDLQRYDEAAAEYEAAYEAKPDPALLYNLGQSYRLAGKYERALRAYQNFLRHMPQSPQRADVEKRIEELRAQEQTAQEKAAQEKAAQEKAAQEKAEQVRAAQRQAEQERAVAAVAPASAASAAPSPKDSVGDRRRARTLKWAGLGVGLGGAVLVVSGAGIYGAGVAAYNQINSPTAGEMFDPATERRMNALRPTGVALFSIGLAATATGFTLFGVGRKRERGAPPSAQVWIGGEATQSALLAEGSR